MFSRIKVRYRILTIIAILSIEVIITIGAIEPVGAARNLTVAAFEETIIDEAIIDDDSANGILKLNVTWLPPEGGRSPTFYSVLVTSIPRENSSYSVICPEESIYYRTENGNQLEIQLPETSSISNIPELLVRPGCGYRIQVYANPRTDPNLEPSTVEYKVPECLGDKCRCVGAKQELPKPKVLVERHQEDEILIKWSTTMGERDVESYTISFGVPILVSNGGLSVYNTTKLAVVSSSNDSFAWSSISDRKDIRIGGIVSVTAEDSWGCEGDEGIYELAPIQSLQDASGNDNAWIALVAGAGGIGIALGILGFVWIRDRKRYRLIGSSYDSNRPLQDVTLTRCSNYWGDKILKKYNESYVTQEIEDAIRRGEADALEVPFSRVRFVRELGNGQFGKVYLANLVNPEETITVAVKLSNRSDPNDITSSKAQLLEEIAMMKIVGPHPHLVQLIGCCTLPENPICAILEYMEGGDLLGYLHRVRERLTKNLTTAQRAAPRSPRPSISETLYTTLGSEPPTTPTSPTFSANDVDAIMENSTYEYVNVSVPRSSSRSPTSFAKQEIETRDKGNNSCNSNGIETDEFLRFAMEIAKGMQHLEAMGIIHRDLAARNVLLDSNLSLKVSDFGLSRNGIYVMAGGMRRLPVRWMSPEALRERAFSTKSDVWSFAVVLWEIGTLGAFPYHDVRDEQLLGHVLSEKGLLARPEAVSPDVYALMRACWSQHPDDRPNFAQLVPRLQELSGSTSYFPHCGAHNPCYEPFPSTRAELQDSPCP